jgi:uncharacterized membrane protein (UPF0127 family)
VAVAFLLGLGGCAERESRGVELGGETTPGDAPGMARDRGRSSEAAGRASPADSAAARRRTFETVVIGGERFRLELAAEPVARDEGLMYRTRIPPGEGMLFVFPDDPQVRSFWMRNCIVDIDVIFVDPIGRVTATHAMKVEPPQQPGETEEEYFQRLQRYPSRLPARYAIELPGGTLGRLRVAIGDTIALDRARLAAISR